MFGGVVESLIFKPANIASGQIQLLAGVGFRRFSLLPLRQIILPNLRGDARIGFRVDLPFLRLRFDDRFPASRVAKWPLGFLPLIRFMGIAAAFAFQMLFRLADFRTDKALWTATAENVAVGVDQNRESALAFPVAAFTAADRHPASTGRSAIATGFHANYTAAIEHMASGFDHFSRR